MDIQVLAWFCRCLISFWEGRDGVIGYVDSDFSGDLDKRRSLTGYVIGLKCVLCKICTPMCPSARVTSSDKVINKSIVPRGLGY